MTHIVPFEFEGSAIRVVDIDGAPWFVGKDVAERLGYANPTDAISKHCKGVAKRYPLLTAGGTQDIRILSEPDVLRLIMGSRLPAAERFERWVFEEVLPSIRRTGGYGIGTTRADDIAQEAARIVLARLGMVPDQIGALDGKVDQLLIVTNELAMNRRVTIPVNVVKKHLSVLHEDGGNCPHCKKPLVYRGESINAMLQRRCLAWEADHFFANMSANFEHTWVICTDCHNLLTPWRPGPTTPRIGAATRKFEGYHEGAKEVLRRMKRGEAEAEAQANTPLFAVTGNILPRVPRSGEPRPA
jgi:prophage antirepressor-like protein